MQNQPQVAGQREEIQPSILTHYLDESGHDSLFDKHGRCIVGRGSCSHTFCLACAHIANEQDIADKLADLRLQLLADPALSQLASLDPATRKTARLFHAKDDHRLVRERVFDLLATSGVKVHVAFRRKLYVAWMIRNRAEFGGDHEAPPGRMYQNLVLRLMTKRFQSRAVHHRVIVAHRAKADKWAALKEALRRAEKIKRVDDIEGRLTIEPAYPDQHVGLQVVDYYLWALQRLLERGEDQHFNRLRHGFVEIYDLDDKTTNVYGKTYSLKNPLTIEKLKPVKSG